MNKYNCPHFVVMWSKKRKCNASLHFSYPHCEVHEGVFNAFTYVCTDARTQLQEKGETAGQ